LALGVLALGLGLGANHLRTDGIPLWADWSPAARLAAASGESMAIPLERAEEFFLSREALFVDARSPALYAEGHIAGAVNLPWQQVDDHMEAFLEAVPDPDRIVIAYCDGEACELSEELAKMLQQMGFRNVKVLINGWTAWHTKGNAITIGTMP